METHSVKFRAIFLVLLIGIGIVILFALHRKDRGPDFSPPASLETGLPAPDFSLPGLDGKTVRLSDFRGKVVLINIWATWCPPCVEEMPSMERLYRELTGKAFEILAVSVDGDGLKAVGPFMRKQRLTFPVLLDPDGFTKDTYGTTGIPESFIVDRNGILIQKIIGARRWSDPAIVDYFRKIIDNPESKG